MGSCVMAQDALTKLARGSECMVRIPSVCNFDSSTTVLAHLNMVGISGRGIKSPSLLGAHACSECHRCIDSNGSTHGLERDYVRLAFFEGMARTQYLLSKLGKIKA
jgi:hypothetical protein